MVTYYTPIDEVNRVEATGALFNSIFDEFDGTIANIVNGALALTSVNIDGGAIDGAVIGANSAAAGTFTALTATGTSTLTTVDINGGAIDGAVIGANSAATANVTTLTASTIVQVSGQSAQFPSDSVYMAASTHPTSNRCSLSFDGKWTFFHDANADGSNHLALYGGSSPANVIVLNYSSGDVTFTNAVNVNRLGLAERSSDPSNPAEGNSVIWQSDGTGTGDDGDILIKITAGGVTKTTTLVDFSAV